MSDIRLIMVGTAVIFAGFIVGGLAGSNYSQIAIQTGQFEQCYDYSSGTAITVNCTQKTQDAYLSFALSVALIGIGSFIIVKGIRGKWDQNVKSNEMVGPKR